LHEDHADFGGGFEDEFAVARGVGGIVEGDGLVGDGACAVAETGDAGAEGLRRESGAPGASRLAEDLTEGFEDLGGVLGDEADGFAVDEEGVVADGGFDDEILLGRDTDEQGELEVDGTEAVEESDKAVGVAATDGEVATAKSFPACGEGQVELFVVDTSEELGVGGGTTSGDGSEGAALAEEAAKIEEGAGGGGDFLFIHRDSKAPNRT
jgi:hypothetical protein